MTVMGVWQPVPPVSAAPMPPPPRSLSEELFPAHWHVDVCNGDGWWLALPHRGTDGLLPKRLSASLHQSRWQSPPPPTLGREHRLNTWSRLKCAAALSLNGIKHAIFMLVLTGLQLFFWSSFRNFPIIGVIHTFYKKTPKHNNYCQIWMQHPELYFHPYVMLVRIGFCDICYSLVANKVCWCVNKGVRLSTTAEYSPFSLDAVLCCVYAMRFWPDVVKYICHLNIDTQSCLIKLLDQ